MIQLKNISLSFGSRTLFDAISLTIDPDERIGLVGLNGAGKSTLLKVIAKEQRLDDGSIQIPKDISVAYMSQETVLLTDKSVIDEAMTAFVDAELEDIARLESEALKMLDGLGFTPEQINGPVDALSVGWKMRLVLAKLLLKKADFYLFDEPTNHLDIVAKDWFISFLKRMPSGFLLVCHEQFVLDQLCTKIIDLTRGKATSYQGNYSAFVVKKQEADERHYAAYIQQQKMVEQKQATIARFRAGTKAKMAQSMLKALDKIDLIAPPEPMVRTLAVPLPTLERSGRIVITVEKVGFSFGEKPIFNNVSFSIERGERVAIVSKNGMGKTTLLNVIAGLYKPQKGSIEFGHNVSYALFHQDPNRSLNLNNSIYNEIMESATKKTEQEVRSMLGAFLFSGEDIHKKIKVLSGGEKNRVSMVKVLLQGANFLILDEPTNHLDIPSKEVLLSALQQYQGTILFVSHDHMFLNQLPTRILELAPNGVYSYSGNYENYSYHKKLDAASGTHKLPNQSDEKQTTSTKKIDGETRKQISSLESKITKLENQVKEIQQELLNHEYGTLAYTQSYDKLVSLTTQHHELVTQWEALHTL